MVRAILEGRKTQARRVVKWTGIDGLNLSFSGLSASNIAGTRWALMSMGASCWQERGHADCPYGVPGDRLWVRETFYHMEGGPIRDAVGGVMDVMEDEIVYRADGNRLLKWTPSIHMPRWASRITLELTDVRVQRLQEISHHDALAEGVEYDVSREDGAPLPRFRKLWDSINAKTHPWSSNPWVWVISFKLANREDEGEQ
jgi:hypothetical protein